MYIGHDNLKTLLKAVTVYGERQQEDVAIEELSELIKALIKHRRYNTKETKENIIEELADVYIMLIQLTIIHGFDDSFVNEKIERLKQRLESEVEPDA
jgi:NTP pyrophosphatase (non-canonical NTP hydrolase)